MTISYGKLFKLLSDRGIKKMELKEAVGMGSSTLAKLSRGELVSMDVVIKICAYLGCNVGEIMDVIPDQRDRAAEAYIRILEEELIPSLGCTEPSSIAFAAARAREVLGDMPERCVVEVSGNMIKNARSVIVPNTGGMKGIKAAAAGGIIAGRAQAGLEVLEGVTQDDIAQITDYLRDHLIEVVHSENPEPLYVSVTLYRNADSARVTLVGDHLAVAAIERNGECVFVRSGTSEDERAADCALLNIRDIFDFAQNADIEAVRPLIERQIACNCAISREGLENSWGANIGKAILNAFGSDIKMRAAASAAAGSDARMGGCDMPVIIVSGSGNQGITACVPVAEFARGTGCSDEMLHRAVILSDLVTVDQKRSIGKLSAFCGVVCAACGAAAGIAFLLGGDYDVVAHTIVNTLAVISGMVCDGAKPSCAAKIAVAVHSGMLGYSMYANEKMQFLGGDGIVRRGVDNTIASVGRMASLGMRETDREILRIMTEYDN
ncbi:MAG: L-serine ammonia-lyase, iron-sulfur-dependent, subunit alpha [Oscillospiraceae bacterium]|nr:L-serine ammonia-lyase, iron-sulfur-dependent, subunit alpha [Oscillospiraceae bacterium]